MTVARIPCLSCVHFQGEARCAAFPDGIPLNYIRGELHDTPRGDEVDGITYTPTEGAPDFPGSGPPPDPTASLEALEALAHA